MSKDKPSKELTDREKQINKLREELGITRAAAAEMLDQEEATKPDIPVGGIGGAGTEPHKSRRMKTAKELRLADTVEQGGDVPPLAEEAIQ